jgi:hypothetical protein
MSLWSMLMMGCEVIILGDRPCGLRAKVGMNTGVICGAVVSFNGVGEPQFDRVRPGMERVRW